MNQWCIPSASQCLQVGVAVIVIDGGGSDCLLVVMPVSGVVTVNAAAGSGHVAPWW